MKWIRRAGHFASAHRHNAFARWVDHCCVRFHKAFENRDNDLDRNGERRVLRTLARTLEVRTVLDVGANVGDWSRAAADAFPEAAIHAFEIVPGTGEQLRRNCAGLDRIRPHALGLSDFEGDVQVHVPADANWVATCLPDITQSLHGLPSDTVTGRVTTGDLFCARHGIGRIDMLKIDVEGLEPKVLAGFRDTLVAGRVQVIQFEYGHPNIQARFLLRDFYELLAPLGYAIGKIYPRCVEFREYRFQHEDFLGPNFLAVRTSLDEVVSALARGR